MCNKGEWQNPSELWKNQGKRELFLCGCPRHPEKKSLQLQEKLLHSFPSIILIIATLEEKKNPNLLLLFQAATKPTILSVTNFKFKFMWVSLLLTCYLVIDNGMCKFEHSGPESISSSRGMQDSYFSRGYLDSTSGPWSDQYSPLSMDEPQAIQPLDWRMPREESETMGTAGKKKKTRKERLEELARLPPPFDLVGCNEPPESDKKMVFDAVRSLKQWKEGDMFIKDQEKEYIIRIQEYQLKRFLAWIRDGGSDGKGILGMDGPSSAASTTKSPVTRHDRKRDAVKALLPASSLQVPEFRSKYASQVMKYFEPSILEIKAHMIHGNSAKRNQVRLDYFDHLLTFLPLYLFHVDMINVVIPELRLDGQATLEAQRPNAGQQFLQHAIKLVTENDRSLYWKKEVFVEDGRKKYYYQVNHPSSFFWGIIRDWIALSRESLANVIIDNDDKMNPVFKQFFNEILVGFIEPLSKT
jgi:hypothetical protein